MKEKKSGKPSKILESVLLLFVKDRDKENLAGDFEQYYSEIEKKYGKFTASVWYFFQIIKLMPSFLTSAFEIGVNMFLNYLRITFRNIIKYKTFNLIKISGLSIGLSLCILVFFFIQHEYSYDNFHRESNKIFNIGAQIKYGDKTFNTVPSAALALNVKNDFPEVISYIRLQQKEWLTKYKNKVTKNVIMKTDNNFFNFFDFELIKEDPDYVFSNPGSVVITEETADKLFGSEDPIGKIILFKSKDKFNEYSVTGVAKNNLPNSSIRFTFLVNYSPDELLRMQNWESQGEYTTLVRLNDEKKSQDFITKVTNKYDKYKNEKDRYKLTIFPLIDVHLSGTRHFGIFQGRSSPNNAYILGGIALMIFSIGCFNFMNLTIGNSHPRIKEIGMRKVLGAKNNQIIKQFLQESLLISLIAVVFGLFISQYFLHGFNALAQREIKLDYLGNLKAVFFLVLLTFFCGIIAGIYPSLKFSKLQSADIFRHKIKIGGKNIFTRILVTLQFAVSIFFISVTYMMNKQQDLIMNRNLGFRKDLIVTVEMDRTYGTASKNPGADIQNIKHKLLQYYNIISVTATSGNFTSRFDEAAFISKEKKAVNLSILAADKDILHTFDIELIEGSSFTRDNLSDIIEKVLINEKFIDVFGVVDPIGKKLKDVVPTRINEKLGNADIIGVVKDFQYGDLKREIVPLIIAGNPRLSSLINIKIKPENISQTIKEIGSVVASIAPDQPFKYSFMDEDIANLYREEKRWNQIISLSSIIAIVIACMGLFGLSLISVESRKKEIAIRKVLGSSINSLIILLNKEFLGLVFLANILAWPFAFYVMTKWLDGFVFRINLNFSYFIISGSIAVLIAIFTVIFLSLKASLANPIDSIKNE